MCQPAFDRVGAGHREDDGEVGRQNYNGCGGQPPMSLARDVTTVGGATLASRLLGFARDVAIAAALGAGVPSDAFFAVLQIANFFRRLLAEGALNAAFVPLWLRIKETQGENGAYAFFRQVLGASPRSGCCSHRRSSICLRPALIGSVMHLRQAISASPPPISRSPVWSSASPGFATRRDASWRWHWASPRSTPFSSRSWHGSPPSATRRHR